jgi:hypothetical protein
VRHGGRRDAVVALSSRDEPDKEGKGKQGKKGQ